MELDHVSSLPYAHQQIRLGDIQAATQKWTTAIEYYTRAMACFKTIENTLQDASLISTIQAQLVQCEKTIHFCRSKDRSEQAMKAECHSRITRAHSVSNIKPSAKVNRVMQRHNTLQLENTVLLDGRGGMDSFAALIFPNNKPVESTPKNPSPVTAKKNKKNDSQKMEELQTSCEAYKSHLKVAFDDIERLKHEINELRMRNEVDGAPSQVHFRLLSPNQEDNEEERANEESENELEATL